MAVAGQTRTERPHATEQRQCEHARRDQDWRGGSAGRATKPAREPAKVNLHERGCVQASERGLRNLGMSKKGPNGCLLSEGGTP